MHRRMFIIAGIFTAVSILYLLRLGALQFIGAGMVPVRTAVHGDWRKASVLQREHRLIMDTGRGDFVDRTGKPLTGETYPSLAFFPIAQDALDSPEGQKQLGRIAAVLEVNSGKLKRYWQALEHSAYWEKEREPVRLTAAQQKELQAIAIDGVKVIPYHNRYLHGYYAAQAIGFVSQHPEWITANHGRQLASGGWSAADQTGGSGLERSLDELLHGVGATSAMYFTDSLNKPLHGLGMRITGPDNHYYPLQIVSTLDLNLQRQLEAYADDRKLEEGAIVVLDANNADIVAMVSRPKMNPSRLQTTDESVNHALKAVPPGSIFKLVTEAAALEAGIANEKETFHCTGEYGKYGLSCWKKGGHGTITLREGLAQSCNIVFATLAERLEAKQLQQTAWALGIGRKIGWSTERPYKLLHRRLRLLPEEEAGTIFPLPEQADSGESAKAALRSVDGGALAQSGIGQRDVRMTPLQAANLMVTILHGGQVLEPRIVSQIRYANGVRMAKLSPRKAPGAAEYGQISPATARKLMRGMEAVVDHGTGQSIREGIWTVAGKSGTAEANEAGISWNNQWFAGYGPVQKPRYAVAVLSEHRPPNSRNQATAVFRGVMDILAKNEHNDS